MSMRFASAPISRRCRYRAYLWLARGDYAARLVRSTNGAWKCAKPRVLAVDGPRWKGETLQGRSILLVAEQGLGRTSCNSCGSPRWSKSESNG